MQCPVCRETLVYDLCALKAAPPPQHPLVRGGGLSARLRPLAGWLQLGQRNRRVSTHCTLSGPARQPIQRAIHKT